MATAVPASQTSKTVPVQDVQHFSLGQRTNQAGLRNPVPLVPRRLIRGVVERIDRCVAAAAIRLRR